RYRLGLAGAVLLGCAAAALGGLASALFFRDNPPPPGVPTNTALAVAAGAGRGPLETVRWGAPCAFGFWLAGVCGLDGWRWFEATSSAVIAAALVAVLLSRRWLGPLLRRWRGVPLLGWPTGPVGAAGWYLFRVGVLGTLLVQWHSAFAAQERRVDF